MPLPKEQYYTYADLLSWEEDTRYELYDGQPVALASPSNIHQLVSGELFRQLANYLSGKRCKIYPAPFDVRLFEKPGESPGNVDTVAQVVLVHTLEDGSYHSPAAYNGTASVPVGILDGCNIDLTLVFPNE